MASRTFEIRTEPHVAHIGDVNLRFHPEADGATFAAGYSRLRVAQQRAAGATGKASSSKHAKEGVDAEALAKLSAEMRAFVASFLMPESKETFETMALPDRILVDLMTWVAELYGGGSGDDAGNPPAGGGTSTA